MQGSERYVQCECGSIQGVEVDPRTGYTYETDCTQCGRVVGSVASVDAVPAADMPDDYREE